jgi:hypothetical protein
MGKRGKEKQRKKQTSTTKLQKYLAIHLLTKSVVAKEDCG